MAAPSGVAIATRLRTSVEDEHVLDAVAEHLGRLRRADLARVVRPEPVDSALDADARRRERRGRLNTRKAALTAQSSARWANAIIAANDDQYRLARDAQYRHIVGLRAAIATIEKRLAAPTADTLTVEDRKARRKTKTPRGYSTRTELFEKQQPPPAPARRAGPSGGRAGPESGPGRGGRCSTGQDSPSPRRRGSHTGAVARRVGRGPLPDDGDRLR